MKLRVALCAAVLLSGTAAFAQSQPWRFGLYDKLQPRDAPAPRLIEYSEPSQLKKAAIAFVVPREKADAHARLIGYRVDNLSRVNYFKLAPPKSKGQ